MNKIKSNITKYKNLKAWQKKSLIFWFSFTLLLAIVYLGFTGYSLYTDKVAEESYWESHLLDNEEIVKEALPFSKNATTVTAGTYIENLKELNIKNNYFRIVFDCWFRWNGNKDLDMINNFDIYNGAINKLTIIDDFTDGDTHYQRARVDATISQNYWTTRFPLESYQLHVYLESLHAIDDVLLVADTAHSTINEHITLSGYKFERNAVSINTVKYDNNMNDPEPQSPYNQELVTSLEINRDGIGLYIKCFVALLGTLTWVFITLFICTYHRVDPLGMIPGALFGTVTNIMVGANLLPDSLRLGLLEYVNFAGVAVIVLTAISVININRIRNEHQNMGFAKLYGRMMLYMLLTFTLIGIFWFPLMAYKF